MKNPRIFLLLAGILGALVLLAACGGGDDTKSGGTATSVGASPGTPTPAVGTPLRTIPAPSPSVNPSKCPPATGTAPEAKVKTYPAAPEMTIDPTKKYTATVKTVRGDFTIELMPDVAPKHVNSFVFLAKDGYYDGVKFHRVVPGFVAQTGDPTGTGQGGPGYQLDLEPSNVKFERGVVGMARTNDPNSAGSQWFVTFGNAEHLTGSYTVFGYVSKGMDVVDCIAQGEAITGIDIAQS